MTTDHQSQVVTQTLNGSCDAGALEGAHRATGDAPASQGSARPGGTDSEVVARAKRRQFSKAEKRRILAAIDRCTQPGEIGALLRREGVYSSSVSTWRRQREVAELAALAPQKRGPKADPNRAEIQHFAKLTRENERLKNELDKAMLIIGDRGRDAHYWAPPAQIRTGPIRAYGSYRGCLTAKRTFGHG